MHISGIVSISFRNHSPDKILSAAAEAGLSRIEWGSDVHALKEDPGALAKLAAAQMRTPLRCCSYGTYFRLGISPLEELPDYIRAAKKLGTNILRIWAGRRTASQYTPEERKDFLKQCAAAASVAEAHGVILCLECHRRSYTETKEGALELMEYVDSPISGCTGSQILTSPQRRTWPISACSGNTSPMSMCSIGNRTGGFPCGRVSESGRGIYRSWAEAIICSWNSCPMTVLNPCGRRQTPSMS